MAFPSVQEYADQLLPFVQRTFIGATDQQHRAFALHYAESGPYAGNYEGRCNHLDTSDPGTIVRFLKDVARSCPELVTPPPSAQEALALIDKDGKLGVEARMSKYRELQSLPPGDRLAAVDIAALIDLRSLSTAPKPAQQTSTPTWEQLTDDEKIRRAARTFRKPEHDVLASDLAKLANHARGVGHTERDEAYIQALRGRVARGEKLDVQSAMTLHRWDNPIVKL